MKSCSMYNKKGKIVRIQSSLSLSIEINDYFFTVARLKLPELFDVGVMDPERSANTGVAIKIVL